MIDVTFFAWSDTHFGYQQQFAGTDLRWHVIQQMNALPGWPYPPGIGGCVDEPAFVMHCGDIVDACADPERAFFVCRHFVGGLRWARYETLGNHDGSRPFMADFLGRHGSATYAFDAGGVHCLSMEMEYDDSEKGTVPQRALDFVRDDLAGVAAGVPVVLFGHASLNQVTNTQDVLDALGEGKVVLAVAGHHHKPSVYSLGGLPCVDVGHCRDHPIDAEFGRSITVFRLRGNELTAVPWRWDLREWEQGQRWSDDVGRATVAAERLILRATF